MRMAYWPLACLRLRLRFAFCRLPLVFLLCPEEGGVWDLGRDLRGIFFIFNFFLLFGLEQSNHLKIQPNWIWFIFSLPFDLTQAIN